MAVLYILACFFIFSILHVLFLHVNEKYSIVNMECPQQNGRDLVLFFEAAIAISSVTAFFKLYLMV